MATLVFGPVRGAGTQVSEKEGDKQIQPGALGPVGYAGILEKGMVGELIHCLSKKQFLKKCGSYISDSQLPDAAIDFFDVGEGAGSAFIVRVTDGNELPAETYLYARKKKLTVMGKLTAKNGGRWGGKAKKYTNDMAAIGDLANTALTTGITTWKTDQWKGGYIELADVPNKQYKITGNTAAGVISVAADQTMRDDYDAIPGTTLRYYLVLENEEKALSVRIYDGIERPNEEFGMEVFVDGVSTLNYPNLSIDPDSALYWVDIVNNDGNNDEVVAEDLWTGSYVASVRPANHYGEVNTITALVLTAIIHDFTINSPTGGNPTLALGTTTDAMVRQKITVTMSSPTAGAAVSDKFGALGAVTLGTPFVPNNKWTPPFTVTAGATPLVAADTLVIDYKPFVADSLIGGDVYPDKPNYPKTKFRVTDNDHKTVTVQDGSDMTTVSAIGDEFQVVAALELEGGRDGNADVTDVDYSNQAWTPTTSPFNQIRGKNQGLIKYATPGITSTAVQKAGVNYAKSRNGQYRYEVPSSVVTEQGVDEYVNDTLGRSNYAAVEWPSFGYVPDPLGGGQGKLKLTTLTGQIHGREATIARDWNGYHKAGTDETATLPKVVKLPTGDNILDEEYLTPLGINVVKKLNGNFVAWGDRTLWLDPQWKWKHQRELMSYYECVLMESFNWIVFAINDPLTQDQGLTALKAFFLPEWTKRAIRGDTFGKAAVIKVDNEINTDVTRDAGDLNAEISLRLADTVERFKILIGKQGLFEA